MALFSRAKQDGADGERPAENDAASPPPARQRTVGMQLREARQGFGRDLRQVGSALRIRASYLQAIEEGRWDELPGAPYAIGFIRTYADYLGLDGVEMVRRFKQETEGLELRRDLNFPVPLTERNIPGGTILLVALILAICGYGIWYYLSSTERSRPERVGAVPSTLLAPPSETAYTPAPPAEPPHPIDAAAAPPPLPRPEPEPPVAAVLPAPPPAPPPPAPAPQAAPPAAPPPSVASLPPVPEVPSVPVDPAHVFGVATGPVRIVLRATSDSWIQVRDASDTLVFTRLMRAGDVYRVPDKPGLTMRTGNAGGLEVTVDGNAAPSLGGIGILRRSVQLDPQKLAAGEAVSE
jgi:cytoskeleton protein RodZ